jgi:hypothetical protein
MPSGPSPEGPYPCHEAKLSTLSARTGPTRALPKVTGRVDPLKPDVTPFFGQSASNTLHSRFQVSPDTNEKKNDMKRGAWAGRLHRTTHQSFSSMCSCLASFELYGVWLSRTHERITALVRLMPSRHCIRLGRTLRNTSQTSPRERVYGIRS